jgi:hypothetical protein
MLGRNGAGFALDPVAQHHGFVASFLSRRFHGAERVCGFGDQLVLGVGKHRIAGLGAFIVGIVQRPRRGLR